MSPNTVIRAKIKSLKKARNVALMGAPFSISCFSHGVSELKNKENIKSPTIESHLDVSSRSRPDLTVNDLQTGQPEALNRFLHS